MPAALIRKLKAHGVEPYVGATGELRFKAPWPPTAVPADVKPLLAEAKRMHHLLVAFLQKPERHPLCGHTTLWLSKHGVWCCYTCHPPAPGAAVWPPPEELPPRVEAVPVKCRGQTVVRDLWEYPVKGGHDPIDYCFNPRTGVWEYSPGWWRKLLH